MKPIKVAFLGLYFEAWDALDEIYRLMLQDPRFEPVVISLPRKLTGQLAYAGEEKAHEFFESQGIEHLRFNSGGRDSQNTVPASVKLIRYRAPLELRSNRRAIASEKVITSATIKPIGVAASSEAVTE